MRVSDEIGSTPPYEETNSKTIKSGISCILYLVSPISYLKKNLPGKLDCRLLAGEFLFNFSYTVTPLRVGSHHLMGGFCRAFNAL